MDRTTLRWILIALVGVAFLKWGLPYFTGSSQKAQSIPVESYSNAPGFIPDRLDPAPCRREGPMGPRRGGPLFN